MIDMALFACYDLETTGFLTPTSPESLNCFTWLSFNTYRPTISGKFQEANISSDYFCSFEAPEIAASNLEQGASIGASKFLKMVLFRIGR